MYIWFLYGCLKQIFALLSSRLSLPVNTSLLMFFLLHAHSVSIPISQAQSMPQNPHVKWEGWLKLFVLSKWKFKVKLLIILLFLVN